MKTKEQLEFEIAQLDAAMRDAWDHGANGKTIRDIMAARFDLENELLDAQDAQDAERKFDWLRHAPLVVLGLIAAWLVLA